MKTHPVAVLTLLVLAVGGCAAEQPEGALQDPAEPDETLDLGKADAIETTSSYYFMRRDYRRCASPMCGGWFVTRPNRLVTRCSDGSYAAECYVAEVDWSRLALSADEQGQLDADVASGRAFVRADLEPLEHERGDYYRMVLTEAWRGVSDAEPYGVFYHLTDNGVRCVTHPCFSIHEARLHSTFDREISSVDASATGATDEEIARALEGLGRGGVMAAGFNWLVRRAGPAGRGILLEATQLYTRVVPAPVEATSCETDADCALGVYGSYVHDASECYCPRCPVPMTTSAIHANAASWSFWCEYPPEGCPLPVCPPPPPVGCRADHTCGYVFDEG
ncbi:MAG: hypothetical protein IT379_01490 [Deltaproteobacteria bacterium]|nr:hypothetical protein [Deltaproteobacteria bacterium]